MRDDSSTPLAVDNAGGFLVNNNSLNCDLWIVIIESCPSKIASLYLWL